MTPDQIRTFLAVSRLLNHTRAAKELHLSQSAVWRRIRLLEEELGVRLFEQFGKTLHLTDAGRTLAHEGEELLGHIGRIVETVQGQAKGLHGRLRVGASTTPGYFLLPRALGRLHQEHPGIELRYEVENSTRIEQQLLRNELDLGFVGGHVQSEELETEQLTTDRIVCIASPSHALARRSRLRPEELVRELCVIREPGSATRQLFESWLVGLGLHLENTLVVKTPQEGMALVAAGLGFTFVSRFALRDRSGPVEELNVSGLSLQRPITVAWHRGKHLQPSMTRLRELAQKEARPPRP